MSSDKPMSEWAKNRAAAEEYKKEAKPPIALPPKRMFTERQRVEQIIEKCQLSEWEDKFCASVLTWLCAKEGNYLSMKQRIKLEEIEKDFGLDPFDAGDSPLPTKVVTPYAKSATRSEQRDDQSGPIRNRAFVDDMDDDIPF